MCRGGCAGGVAPGGAFRTCKQHKAAPEQIERGDALALLFNPYMGRACARLPIEAQWM
jgi:hypothetical protein